MREYIVEYTTFQTGPAGALVYVERQSKPFVFPEAAEVFRKLMLRTHDLPARCVDSRITCR